jgi:protocatechuate 3,4-dioxygenase beta subunit
MAARALVLVLALAVAGAIAWLAFGGAQPAAPNAASPAEAARAAAPAGPGLEPTAADSKVFESLPARDVVETIPSELQGHRFQNELALRVVDPTGAPVEGAGVYASTDRGLGGVRLNGRTDGDGTCRMALPPRTPLPGEPLTLTLSPPAPWKALTWSGPFPREMLAIVLQRGGTLRGEVRYEDGDELVQGGSLGVKWDLGDGRTGNVQAPIEGGRYELSGVAGVVTEVYLFRPKHRLLRNEVSLPVADDTQLDYDAVFFRGLTVEVDVVTAADGAPIAGAGVQVLHSTQGITDEAGHAVLERALDRGASSRVLVSHPEYEKADVAVTAHAESTLVTVRVELQQAYVLEGIAIDPRGAPVPKLKVRAVLQELSPSGMGSRRSLFERAAVTDDEGRFRITGVPICSGLDLVFRRVVEGEHFIYNEALATHTLDVPRDLERGEWLIDDPVALSGVVLDHEGNPSVETYVAAHSRRGFRGSEVRTDAEGRFDFTGLFPGPWTLAVAYGVNDDVDGYKYAHMVTQRIDVGAAGRGDVEIRLPPVPDEAPHKGLVELRATDARTGAPVETGFSFLMVNGVDYEASRGISGPAFEDGRYRFWAPAGRWDVWLWHAEYASFHQMVDVQPGFEPLVVEALLAR